MTNRRSILQFTGLAAGTGALGFSWSQSASGQDADAALTDRLRADLQTHASFGLKSSGSAGDNATADWTAMRLRALGYHVETTGFEAPFFRPRSSELHVGSASYAVVAQAPVLVTPASGVSANLTVVEEDGLVGDLKGKIAVIIAPFARHAALFPNRGIGMTVREAAAAGARAIVLVTTGPSGEAVALNCPDEGPYVAVPLAILAPKLATPVIEAARAGAMATLVVDGEAGRRPNQNVIARIERGSEWIAMSTPRSGWYDCVAERGTGQAAFLELAAWLAREYPQHSIFLMNTGAHEYFFAGSHHAVEAAPPPEQTLVWAHIGATLAARDALETNDGWVMLDTADPDRRTMATASARAAVVAGFQGLAGLDDPGEVRPQAGELSAFTDLGYSTAFACIGLHRWFHTTGDTIERVDAGLLMPVVRAHQASIARLVAG